MLELVKYPNPVLKKSCSPVTIVGKEERDLLENLVKTMYLNQGIGLAAPQIGINRQMAVVDVDRESLLKLINPLIVEAGGVETMEEGCLSIPDVYINVKRPKRIKLKSLDENGREIIMEATDLKARAILHEIDHLRGRLITDYLNPVRRFLILRRK